MIAAGAIGVVDFYGASVKPPSIWEGVLVIGGYVYITWTIGYWGGPNGFGNLTPSKINGRDITHLHYNETFNANTCNFSMIVNGSDAIIFSELQYYKDGVMVSRFTYDQFTKHSYDGKYHLTIHNIPPPFGLPYGSGPSGIIQVVLM